jgi:hypothetical protein
VEYLGTTERQCDVDDSVGVATVEEEQIARAACRETGPGIDRFADLGLLVAVARQHESVQPVDRLDEAGAVGPPTSTAAPEVRHAKPLPSCGHDGRRLGRKIPGPLAPIDQPPLEQAPLAPIG